MSSKTSAKILVVLALCIGYQATFAQIVWPKITTLNKPWARWWWEGSAVNKKDLEWNMNQYQKAGIGGLEVTPIYGVKGRESEFIPYLSPEWMNMFQFTLNEAKRLNMGIDMANATGWPFGGPWVTNEDASKEMFWKTFEIKAGTELTDSVVFIQQPLVRADGQVVPIAQLIEPISANKNLQLMALDQVRFEKSVPLKVLMAYDHNGHAINLTDKVSADGKLHWIAPKGSDWQLYAMFQGLHGKMVERAAPGGEGYAIDHFSRTAIEDYLHRFDEAFKGHDVSVIRAYFNDSYEVDDARGQANTTPELFDEFQKRRGYDLRNFLLALFGKSDEETNKRVITDYRETISDLILDNFTRQWHAWGHAQHKLIRNQSHGSPANILDLYAAVDIPETEGAEILRFKFATSAADVMGKPLASSESATWLNDHFLSSLGDVKQAIDKYFIGGVNHIFYHGIAYSPQSAAWPGWLFYAAVHFSPTNPFWHDFPTLNNYIARCQSFLQQGISDNDVLIYYPLYDSFSEPGRSLLKHYDGMKPDFKGTGFDEVSSKMLEKGYTFDFISDKQVQQIKQSGNDLVTQGNRHYKTIVLPACKVIDLATLDKLLALAKNGANVLVYKKLPSEVPGLGNLQYREAKFKQLVSPLNFIDRSDGVKVASIGKGTVMIGDDIDLLLSAAKIRRETLTDNGLAFVRRKIGAKTLYFIANNGDKDFDGWVTINAGAASVAVYNPMSGNAGLAAIRKIKAGTQVYIQLNRGESCLLSASPVKIVGATHNYYTVGGTEIPVIGKWTINFIQGGAILPPPVKTEDLKSWTGFGGDAYKFFSGTASYNITFAKPQSTVQEWQLRFQKVHENAEVFLNGKKLATLLGPVYTVNIPASSLHAQNKLEVRVTNLMANRIIRMDRENIPYRIFYNTNFQAHFPENRGSDGLFSAAKWDPRPSGIEGRVELIPLLKLNP
ncbi:MAG: glycosyl hydrolase [Sphingobacteriales bacterium]